MREKKNDNKFNELLPRFFYLLKVSPMESLLRSSTHFLDKKIAGKKNTSLRIQVGSVSTTNLNEK